MSFESQSSTLYQARHQCLAFTCQDGKYTPLCLFLEGSLRGQQDRRQVILKVKKLRPRNVEPEGRRPGLGAWRGLWPGIPGWKSLPVRCRPRFLRPLRGEAVGALGFVINGSEWFVMHLVNPNKNGRPTCLVTASGGTSA